MTAASGTWSLCEENLRIALADCATFRTMVGAVDRATALDDIYHEALPPPAVKGSEHTRGELEALRPYAIVFSSPENGFRRKMITHDTSRETGTLEVIIQADVDPADANDPAEVARKFKNNVGNIIDELFALSAQAGTTDSYLVVDDIAVSGPFRIDPDKEETMGDVVMVEMTVLYS